MFFVVGSVRIFCIFCFYLVNLKVERFDVLEGAVGRGKGKEGFIVYVRTYVGIYVYIYVVLLLFVFFVIRGMFVVYRVRD